MEFSEGDWREIAPRVFVMTAQPESVNIGLVVGDQHVLLIDTGSSPEQGRRIADSAAAIAGRPVDRVVITHHHYDHFHGLAGVDAEVSIGHESLVTEDPALANVTNHMSVVKAVDLGGIRVEIVHFGPAHTQGDLAVLLPTANISFTGDLLEIGADPQFGDDSSIHTWPMALDGVLGGSNDHTQFVPGHGEIATRFQVFEQRANISLLYGTAEMLVKRGISLKSALEAIDEPVRADGTPHPGAPEWEWPFSPETIKKALPKLYTELDAQGLQPRTQLPISSV